MDLYFSIDVESDGPIPGQNSMLNFGCAVFSEATGEKVLETFDANLETLEDAEQDPDTMAWWASQPEAWSRVRDDPKPAYVVMARFVQFVQECVAKYRGRAVCVCYPAGYDFTFLYWYLMRFVGKSPFGFSGLVDMKTMAWAILQPMDMRSIGKRMFPKDWLTPREAHTHVGVDDATEQGIMFMRMLKAMRSL